VDSLRRTGEELLGLPRIMPPAAAFADVVEAFMDWEEHDQAATAAVTVRSLPCSAPQLCVHYRSTAWTGVLVARLKPEAASRLIGLPLLEPTDSSVGMRELFGAGPVSVLEEQLAQARTSLERVNCVEAFLLPRLRENLLTPVMHRAVQMLRNYPTLSGQELAARLDMSERHLSRRFRSLFGTSPKQFARVARVNKIVRARWYGGAWTDIAHSLGFFDQSHMINDFKSLVGVTPTQFFGDAASSNRALNSLLGRSPFANFVVTRDFNGRPGIRPSLVAPRYL
jgi:AraC-like DNA-binding protein